MNKYCQKCYLRDAKPCAECSYCFPNHRNFRPIPHTPTNADRIRSMSDEELAEFIESQRVCQICNRKMNNCFPMDVETWLTQPAQEE